MNAVSRGLQYIHSTNWVELLWFLFLFLRNKYNLSIPIKMIKLVIFNYDITTLNFILKISIKLFGLSGDYI